LATPVAADHGGRRTFLRLGGPFRRLLATGGPAARRPTPLLADLAMNPTKLPPALLLAFAVSSAAAQGLLATEGEVVSAFGDPVASIPGAFVGGSSSMDTAAMDLNGNLLWRIRMAVDGNLGISTQNDRILYFGRNDADKVVVARGGVAEPTGTMPGVILGTATLSGVGSSYKLSPTGGIVLFGSSLSGAGVTAGSNDSALFWGPAGNLSVLARRGDATPGGGGSTFNTSYSSVPQASAIAADGTTIFQATLAGGDVVGTTNNFAWLYGTPGNLQVMLRKGDLLPGGQLAIGAIGFQGLINDSGAVLHDETLSTTLGSAPATTANDKVLMVYLPGGGNFFLVREGDPAAGTVGASYGTPNIGICAWTKANQTAFVCDLTGGDVNGTVNNQAIYFGDVTVLSLVARKGDAIPGAVNGELYNGWATSGLQCNSDGIVAQTGFLTGPSVTAADDSAMFAGPAGNLRIVAREGDAAPGVAGGVLGAINSGTGSPHLNDHGQIVFGCDVIVGATTSSATFAYVPGRGLQLLFLGGDAFTTQAGVVNPFNDGGLQFHGGDGAPQTLNNNGDVLRRVNYTGGAANVRCRLGGLLASPASIAATGGTQTLKLDAGATNGNGIYLVAGTLSGTRPGFVYAGSTIPLVNDVWFGLSLAAANSAVYTNTFGFLDAQGKATATFNFPPGFAGFQGFLLHHAFVVIDPATALPLYVSEASSVRLY
jgi:hypothetical protein